MATPNLFWLFLTYGFIGWLWETPYVSICEKRFVNRGFLRGPFIPIYGFAATSIMCFMDFYSAYVTLDSPKRILIAVVSIGLVASFWEYVTSFTMEVAFGTRWWDYSDRKFHLKGRIALVPSVFWGVGGFVLWYVVNPWVMSAVDYVFADQKDMMLWVFYGILILDTGLTLMELISFRKLLTKTQELSERFFEYIDPREPLSGWVQELKFKMKKNPIYQKLEDLTDTAAFQEQVKLKIQALKEQQVKLVDELTLTMIRFKRMDRFIKHYPSAKTKKIPFLLDFTRKKKTPKS